MKYYKNTELAKLYNISEKTVRNWIEATQQGKLNFQLYAEKDKHFIAGVSENLALIEQLVTKGKKFKNTRGYKVIQPRPEFYEIFGPKEIFNIISNLDIHHEVPLEYSYFNGGAEIWDAYVRKLAKEDSINILSSTTHLLDINAQFLDDLLEGTERINIIDIGPGNGYPVRGLLKRFADNGMLNRYIAIDASQDMLNIVSENVSEWFGSDIRFETHVMDITYERFGNLLTGDSFDKENTVKNLVLLFGSTLSNFRDPSQPLATIRESMGKDDILIVSKQLDTPHSRRHFDYYTGNETSFRLTPKSKFVIDLFNIDESLYEAEPFFDEATMSRRLQVRLKVDLRLEFLLDGQQKVIDFNKGDTILLWRHRHQGAMSTLEQFDENGLGLLQAITSKDGEYMLVISKIKTSS